MTSTRAFWAFVVACTVAIGAILTHSYLTYQAVARVAAPANAAALNAQRLSHVTARIVESATGGRDPVALDTPRFVHASQAAEFIAPDDPVFLVEAADGALVFPLRVMNAYPVVNTSVGGIPATFTYSADTQSAVGFWDAVDGISTTFIPSRMYVNRNLVLLDRATGSAWPQLLGIAARGHLLGSALLHVPMYPTTWERVFRVNPDAQVLVGAPGAIAMSTLPGPVTSAPRFADNSLGPVDTRLPVSEQVLGVTSDDQAAAIPIEAVLVRHVVNFDCGSAKLVAIADSQLGIVRVFDRRLGGSGVVLDQVGANIQDRTTRSQWDDRGLCIAGQLKGVALRPVDTVFSAWFAWSAFYPTTEVYR